MRRTLISVLCVVLFLNTSTNRLSASPQYGAELTYEYLGGIDYRINYTIYQTCELSTLPLNVAVYFECPSNPLFYFFKVLPISLGQEITPICSSSSTYCSSGYLFGINKYVYSTVVQLVPCGVWKISCHGRCIEGTTTIQYGNNFWVETFLNDTSAAGNNSPVFRNNPPFRLCIGQTSSWNHGAFDPDGDSLAYALVQPGGTGSWAVTYWPPYSATQPIISVPPVSIDAATGSITMTPVTAAVSLMAVRVEEWRKINGIMVQIGSITRFIQFRVESCNSSIPTLSGIDESLSSVYSASDTMYYSEICLGSTIDFTIKGFDADTFPSGAGSSEVFGITWDQGISGANFTSYHNSSDTAYARFTWTPGVNDLSDYLHCFSAIVRDEACPYNNMQSFAYCFMIRAVDSLSISAPDTICLNHSATLTADSGFTNYVWSNGDTGQSIQINGQDLGQGLHTYSLSASDGNCDVSTTHSLFVDLCTGIPPSEDIPGLTLFPIPSAGIVNIETNGYKGLCTIELISICGQQIMQESFFAAESPAAHQLNLSHLKTGIYFVKVDFGNQLRYQRLVLQ